MASDPEQIALAAEQKQLLALRAETEGRDYTAILDEWLHTTAPQKKVSDGPKNLLEAFEAVGAVGYFEGPEDLSTHPKHMEGFGINASRKRNSD